MNPEDAFRRYRELQAYVGWMSELHAAVGLVHLESLDAAIAIRRRAAALYDHALAEAPGITAVPVPDGCGMELEAGNLYRHIRQLESDGCVAPAAHRPARGEDERRIYYRLTAAGRRALAAEMLRLRSVVRLAEERGVIAPARA